MTFARPPAGDDPLWPRASAWLDGSLADEADEDAARLRVVGLPCSVGSISPSRADQTPAAVRAALARLSPWDPTAEIDLAQRVRVDDLGDWPIADLDLQDAMDDIERRCRLLGGRADLTAFLGGDNAVTRPIVTGLHGDRLERVGLVTLDAHHDVRHLDDGPRNGTPVRGLVEEGLPPQNIVQLGIGQFTNSAPYAAWCREQGIAWATVGEVRERGPSLVAEVLASLDVDVIHLDIDMDVLDVAFAPACPGARPGGLTPTELFGLVTNFAQEPRVKSVDLVEVDATTDHDGRTVMATAMTLLAVASGLCGRALPG